MKVNSDTFCFNQFFNKFSFWFFLGNSQIITEIVHKTQAAAEKINDLWCYECQTMEDGNACSDIQPNHTNFDKFKKKCHSDDFYCTVKSFSYTTSNENSTSIQRLWLLERNCTKKCESSCIIIGERTKLYACTSCCGDSYCNTGKADGSCLKFNRNLLIVFLIIFIFKNRNVPGYIN